MENIFTLPVYPVKNDMWCELQAEKRPIVIYGMGNGADKLFDRLSDLGISPSAVFASDGFVRGHSFRGFKVRSFSEIREEFSDFVILLSFASNRPEVLEMLCEIDGKYEMYVPDMPIADTTEYFDKDFYNSNYSEIINAYESLADERSKSTFAAIINFKLTGKMFYLEACGIGKDEMYGLLPCKRIKSYIDVGAYNGDTLREAIEYMPSLECAVLVEPDPKTFKRLKKYCDTVKGKSLKLINAAALDTVGACTFMASGNRNSTYSATASHEHSTAEIECVTVDSLGTAPDYIKYDVEGAELLALLGSHNVINANKPALLVSLYHRSRDIFSLVNYLHDKYPFYKLALCKQRCLPAWEINLILTAY